MHARLRLAVLAAVAGRVTGAAGSGDDGVTLVTFDGDPHTTFKWVAENDPVMGGVSHSTFTIEDDIGVFDGAVEIVPSLKAPGFCFLHSDGVAAFPSAKDQTHLELTLRNAGQSAEYENYKVSFAADTLSPQFRNFKADFNVSLDATNWTTVTVPFTQFTNKWSPATGEPTTTCAEDPRVCVTQDDLEHIYQFGIWAEGKAGSFHLELQSVRAITPTSAAGDGRPIAIDRQRDERVGAAGDWNNTCGTRTQKNLRWNVSVAGSYIQLPFVPPGGLPLDESFADAICCDAFFAPYAEPSGFFAEDDVALFDKLDPRGETTFYDSVCGVPLFTAPRNRTFAEWRAESEDHGWPSFRDEEVIEGAIRIDNSTGIVTSKCGTHLGTYMPDSEGDRFCLDLACLSGSPKQH